MTTPTEPEALADLKPILSAISESGKIEAVDWHNIRRAICDGEAAMRERAAQIADAELADIFEDSPEVDAICNSVVREIAKSIRALSTPAARMLAGEGEAVAYASPEQMASMGDPIGDMAGAYIPLRKTPAGKFTMPLYAHPPAAEPVGLRDMPIMRAAFRTTVSGGGKYEMVFRFPSMQALHDADDEWRAALATPARTDDAGVGGLPRHVSFSGALTDADWKRAQAETDRLTRELDITNADHIALWLEENMSDSPIGWLSCRIVEAHEAALSPAPDRGEGEA